MRDILRGRVLGWVMCVAGAAGVILADSSCGLADSQAVPGDVRAPVVSASGTWSILNWNTASKPETFDGVFTLRFDASVTNLSLLTYDAGGAEIESDDGWQQLPVGPDAGLRLRVIPLPSAAPLRAVRFTVPAALTRSSSGAASFIRRRWRAR